MVQGLAAEKRLERLSELLQAAGAIGIAGAAAELGVSEMTIRRDITALEEHGVARRIRGGAVPVGPRTFSERQRRRTREKARMAEKMVALLPVTGAVAFDASSTVMHLASGVTGRDLTVVTNGPETFLALQGRPGITAILTGGRLDRATGSLVGPIACRAGTQFTFETFFASASAVGVRAGSAEPTLEEGEVKRVLADNSRTVVLAADSSKLQRQGMAVGLPWDDIDFLVTELDPADPRLDSYRELVDLR